MQGGAGGYSAGLEPPLCGYITDGNSDTTLIREKLELFTDII